MISLSFILPKEKLTLIDSKMTLAEALDLIEHNNFLSLPVIKDDTFLGVISKEKILSCMMEDCNGETLVELITRTDIPHIQVSAEMEDAASLLAETNTPFVAVVNEQNQFLGIITHKTIFNHYIRIFGINKGHKLIITTYDTPGRLALLTDVISKAGGNIISLLVDNPNVSFNLVKIVLRVESDNMEKLKEKIEEAGFSIRN